MKIKQKAIAAKTFHRSHIALTLMKSFDTMTRKMSIANIIDKAVIFVNMNRERIQIHQYSSDNIYMSNSKVIARRRFRNSDDRRKTLMNNWTQEKSKM